ncbi:MAG: spore coat protein [Omnitrophica WOR_2 bacterium GWA2_63_20]|nr:MAG: spore coat protein [Omnitrophica WOR_2 bacterium GWA2_63_20]HBQ37934.1 spore coat protein [Candidatus Omnitrophota bacterium]
MKGVILAGGLGKRLEPLTRITNKHLLPVYDRPMIYFPVQTLVDAGLTEIMLVVGGNHAGEFLRLLGNGAEFGLRHLNYTYQRAEGGIAEALSLSEHFADGERLVVILGDNILEQGIRPSVERFAAQPSGARLLLKEVEDPGRFGVAEVREGKIVGIEEKPARPKSSFVVTGVYMYDGAVFDIIKTLKPSGRGELEITDVNNAYLRRGQLAYDVLEGWWTDAGLPETLYRATTLVRERALQRQQQTVTA